MRNGEKAYPSLDLRVLGVAYAAQHIYDALPSSKFFSIMDLLAPPDGVHYVTTGRALRRVTSLGNLSLGHIHTEGQPGRPTNQYAITQQGMDCYLNSFEPGVNDIAFHAQIEAFVNEGDLMIAHDRTLDLASQLINRRLLKR